MNEYLELEHMSSVPKSELHEAEYYLPHHGVIQNDSLTTKLRVVFNGSAPTTSGWSANDLQHIGSQIYAELFTILIKFRQHPVAVCADIEKMYRQILIHPDDRRLQKIVWRSDSNLDLCSYYLNTVTYGTTFAPYLAIRCFKQLAQECHETYPQASRLINDNFYVDDLIASFASEQDAIVTCGYL